MYVPKVKSNRQQAKEKAKALKGKVTIVIMCKFPLICADLYFLVQWEEHDEEDGHDLLDVLPAKAIVAEGEVDVVSLSEGNKFRAIFNKVYPVTIKGSGMWLDLVDLTGGDWVYALTACVLICNHMH